MTEVLSFTRLMLQRQAYGFVHLTMSVLRCWLPAGVTVPKHRGVLHLNTLLAAACEHCTICGALVAGIAVHEQQARPVSDQ